MTNDQSGGDQSELSRRALLGGAASLMVAGGCAGALTGPPIVPVSGPAVDPEATLTRIAFGSCLDQEKPSPIFDAIIEYEPQLMLMLGDNVYANAEDEATLREAYAALGSNEGFVRMRESTPLITTWDDHDYGRDDVGSEHRQREMSQRVMLDFFGEPADSPRRTRPGVYRADVVGPPGRRVQVLTLDTRYFRSELRRVAARGRYLPSDDPSDTMLGQAQWTWLEQQLQQPAVVRLLLSSVQLLSNDHDYESWGVMPLQRERLLSLIGSTGAHGVIVLSGDRHHAELSVLEDGAPGYPLYDLTSSSFNRPRAHPHEINRHRVGPMVDVSNFGTIDIDWDTGVIVLRIRDEQGLARLEHGTWVEALAPKPSA
ncbi:MAG: alkaline phosphatase family protein [Deltaproteobacteria bacterium]|nr:alkaline phosphatase family protein [Deltaproteobacteria bacterium]